MNMSRIVKELEQQQLINLQGSKKKQIIFYQKQAKKLWEDIEPLMISPVREVWYSDESPADTPGFMLSNDSALARYSTLNEGKTNSYAIGRNQFRNLMAHKHIAFDPQYGQIRVEVWHYNPDLLSKKTQLIFYLYLSMRYEDDERIKMALEEMVNDIKW